MRRSASPKRYVGISIILGIGVILLIFHIVHAFSAGEDIQTFLLGILMPMTFAIGVLISGIRLWRTEPNADSILRITMWCIAGIISLSVLTEFLILYQQAEGVEMSDEPFVVINSASVGALIGLIVGRYDSRQRVAQQETEQLSQHLSVLNRILRHDIRNNANVIQGHAGQLVESPTNVMDNAEVIQRQADDLVRLGEHAREIEKLLRHRDTDNETIDISSLTRKCCRRIESEYPDAEIDISLPKTQRVTVHPMVDSALMNVLENAVEHNDKQTPQIEVEITNESKNGTDATELRIADNGPGIPEQEREVLDRGRETALSHSDGLGLWLAYWTVEESGGNIWFEHNEPEGTVVCLQFERDKTATAYTSNSTREIASDS